MIFKNAASQGVYVFAFDTVNQSPKTGDAANITAAISKDGAASAATVTTNPTEIGGGIYWLPLSQAETNANAFVLLFSSSTSGVQIDPIVVFTTGGAIPSAAAGSANGLPTLDAAGSVAADLQTIKTRAVVDPGGSVTIPAAIPTANQNADALLARDVANAEAAAPRTSLATSILATTNKANTVDHAGYLTVYRTDGVTEHVRIPIVTNADAVPIEGVG